MKMKYLLASIAALGLPATVSANEFEWSGEIGVNVATSAAQPKQPEMQQWSFPMAARFRRLCICRSKKSR